MFSLLRWLLLQLVHLVLSLRRQLQMWTQYLADVVLPLPDVPDKRPQHLCLALGAAEPLSLPRLAQLLLWAAEAQLPLVSIHLHQGRQSPLCTSWSSLCCYRFAPHG